MDEIVDELAIVFADMLEKIRKNPPKKEHWQAVFTKRYGPLVGIVICSGKAAYNLMEYGINIGSEKSHFGLIEGEIYNERDLN